MWYYSACDKEFHFNNDSKYDKLFYSEKARILTYSLINKQAFPDLTYDFEKDIKFACLLSINQLTKGLGFIVLSSKIRLIQISVRMISYSTKRGKRISNFIYYKKKKS